MMLSLRTQYLILTVFRQNQLREPWIWDIGLLFHIHDNRTKEKRREKFEEITKMTAYITYVVFDEVFGLDHI